MVKKVADQIVSQMADALENTNYKGSINGKSIALLTNKEVQPYLVLAEKLGKGYGAAITRTNQRIRI